MLKRLICAALLLILTAAWSIPFPIASLKARDLEMSVRTEPERFVLEDSHCHIFVTTSDPSWVTIELIMGHQTIIWRENEETTAHLEKHFQIPVVYPLIDDFEIVLRAMSMTTSSRSMTSRKFAIQKRKKGNFTLEGRVLQCSPYHKNGLEGATVEIISGPSPGREKTEDEGYFVFSDLLPGPYILRISHSCASESGEHEIYLDEKTGFQEWCLQTYRIPDMDLWLNKPSGSVFEVGETVTVFMRSSVSTKADLVVIDSRETKSLLRGIHLREDEIQRFFWRPTLSQRLGKVELSLMPLDQNLCGEARYQFQLISNMQTGIIQGRVRLGGRPMPEVEVYLPLQSLNHAWTDERGYFEIPEVPPGIHVVRVKTSDEMYADKHGVEVKKGQITDLIEVNLPSEGVAFELHPPEIHVTTHERREKRIPLVLSLREGIMENVAIQILEGPPQIKVFPDHIPSLLHEKRLIWLIVPDDCPVGDFPLNLRVGNDLHHVEWKGSLQVTGLSRGTFDGRILPVKQTVVQGEQLHFDFIAEKFTNFNGRIALEAISIPLYSQFRANDPEQAPATIGFQVNTSMSTPPGFYTMWIKATSEGLSSWYSCNIEILRSGATLASVPDKVWDPIVSAGQNLQSTISLWSPQGETQNVRVQLAHGPPWLRFDNRHIGTVGEKPIEIPVFINPSLHVLAGAYPYSINLIYGERGQGFFKLEGQIHVLHHEAEAPINLRARHIREEGTIVLTWGTPSKEADRIVGYNIYRSLRYPSLDYAVPINYSLINEKMFVDENFLIGRSYWYIVKAVRSDATLSPPSNTAEIRVNPSVQFSAQITLDKGERTVAFVGEKISLTASASHSANIETWVHQGNWSALVDTRKLIANTSQKIYFQVPDLPGEASIETILSQKEGQKHSSQHALWIQKNLAGRIIVKGKILNSSQSFAISNARWWVWSGPSKAEGYTDADGRFSLSGVSEGAYRLIVEASGSRLLTDPLHISSNHTEELRIDLPVSLSSTFQAWIQPDQIKKEYSAGDFVPISIYADQENKVNISIEMEGIRRPLLSDKIISPERVSAESVMIPRDFPSGEAYLLVASDKPGDLIRIPLFIRESLPDKKTGKIVDIFGNKLSEVSILSESNREFLSYSNEWGFFSVHTTEQRLVLQKQGFEEHLIDISSGKNSNWTMKYATKPLIPQDLPITVSSDYTHFDWFVAVRSGWIPGTFFSIYAGIDDAPGNGDNEQEEAPWRSWGARDLFPGHCYRLHIDGLPLSETSRMIWHDLDEEVVIPIERGLPYRWHAETLPETPYLFAGEEGQIELDLFSFGFYREKVLLELKIESKEISGWILPDSIIPGQLIRLFYSLPEELDTGTYLFYLIVRAGDRKEVRYLPIHVSKPKDLMVQTYEWRPQFYQNLPIEQRFYFSNGLLEPDPAPFLPEGVIVKYYDHFVLVQLQPSFRDGRSFSLPVYDKDGRIANINIMASVYERKTWTPPSISIRSTREGPLLEVNSPHDQLYYKVFRSHRYEDSFPVNDQWLTERQYLDPTAIERETYRYTILATDARLEAGFTNVADMIFRKLFIVLNLREGHVTRNHQIEWKGSVSIGSRLYINDRFTQLSRNGEFSEVYPIHEGPNLFVFSVRDETGNTLTESRTVYRDTQAPSIERISPDENEIHTLEHSLAMRVQTENDAYLSVNGRLVETDERGIGTYESPLEKGKNEFHWVATDRAGNQSRMSILAYRYSARQLVKLQIGNTTAYIDQKAIPLEAPPMIFNGRTLVPLRFMAEAMGSKVDWVAATKTIILTLGDRTIQLQVDSPVAIVNHQERVPLDAPPMIVNGRTLVPLRFIAEVLRGEVEWFPQSKEIYVQIWVW